MRVVEQARFASAFTFQYSIREGTPAATMADQVPKAVVQERYNRLIALQERISLEENQAQVGREVEVLVSMGEGKKDAETHRLTGRAEDNRLVHFEVHRGSDVPRPGDVVTVTITHAAPFHLLADDPTGRRCASVARAPATRGIARRPSRAPCPPRRATAAPARRLARPADAARRRVTRRLGAGLEATAEAPRLWAVVGATGTGKTRPRRSTSLRRCARADDPAEIVNADAMQLYRGMDIGTAKLPVAERRGIPHHLFDVLEVDRGRRRRLVPADARARRSTGIHDRGGDAILVGGSGLYVSSVLFDFRFPPRDAALRARARGRARARRPGRPVERLRARRSGDRRSGSIRATADASCARSRCSSRGSDARGGAARRAGALASVAPDRRSAPVRAMNWSRASTRASSGCGRTGSSTEVEAPPRARARARRHRAPRDRLRAGARAARRLALTAAPRRSPQTQALTRRYARRQVSWFKRYRDVRWITIRRTMPCSRRILELMTTHPRVRPPRHRVRHRPLAGRPASPGPGTTRTSTSSASSRVQPELFFVAVDGDDIVGTVMAGYDGHRGWLYYLAADSDAARRGHRTGARHRGEDALLEMGCPKVQLMVRPDNDDVLRLLRHARLRAIRDLDDGQAAHRRLSRHGAGGRSPKLSTCRRPSPSRRGTAPATTSS